MRRIFGDGRWVYGPLALILLVGSYLRWLPLNGVSFDSIILGDALEYQRLAEFFADPDGPLPPDRYPGFPFLLAALFAVLPFDHNTIQIATSLVLGVVVVALTYVLAASVLERQTGLVVAALAAVHPAMVDNAHRGLSEELYLTCLLVLLTLFRRIKSSTVTGWGSYLLLGISAGAVALVRPDGAHVFIPIFLTFVWRDRQLGLIKLIRTLPILVFPVVLPAISGMWTDAHGIQDMNMRLGRIILWMEFMLGRMPYSYTFYKLTHVNEWLLGYHTFGELVTLGVKSSVRNLLALGEAIWGQVPLLLALVGIAGYVRDHREWVLPLSIPLSVLVQWGIVALWMESDVERYSTRAVPLLLIFLALGSRHTAAWISSQFAVGVVTTRWLPVGVVLFSLSPALLPFSLYTSVRPSVDILMTERLEYLPKSRAIHPELVATLAEVSAGRLPLPRAVETVVGLRARHDAYAPTHFVLGIFYMTQGRRAAAIESLERAVEIVPFFAEAAVLLAELYIVDERREEALLLTEQTAFLRSDYPLLELIRGHLQAMAGDLEMARASYLEYLRLNRYQHERAFVRQQRIMKRRGVDTTTLQQARAALKADVAGLTSPFLWTYLSLDLDGINIVQPEDQTVYYNMGVCDLLLGDSDSALQHWMVMTRVSPADADAWANLGTLQVVRGHYGQARTSWTQALAAAPQHAMAKEGLRQLDEETFRAQKARYASFQFVLPLTRTRLVTRQ